MKFCVRGLKACTMLVSPLALLTLDACKDDKKQDGEPLHGPVGHLHLLQQQTQISSFNIQEALQNWL